MHPVQGKLIYKTEYRIVILFLILMLSLDGLAQSNYEGIGRSMAKGKWNKAQQALRKSLRKDSLNTEARYLYSVFYFSTSNPKFNIDSSYRFARSAFHSYQMSIPRQKERMKRIPLDSAILIDLREQLDSAAFERAKSISTEKSYQDFIDRFAFAKQQKAAVELRDEEAFLDALKVNTYVAFSSFFTRYPASHRAKEARDRYEKLLYDDKTRDKKLKSFELFLVNYPASPFRTEAEKNIFEISTAGGSLSPFLGFLRTYPQSPIKKKCVDMVYHLQKESEGNPLVEIENDSLREVASLERGYWVPVMKNEKFGFMDPHGMEVLAPRYETIDPEYLCGNIRTDFLVTAEGVVGRSGRRIFEEKAESATDLGYGFLRVQTDSCIHVIHKSGFKVNSSCLENARLIAGRFIATQLHNKWGITAFNGKELLPAQYDDIYSIEDIIIFNKSGRKSIMTCDQVGAVADRNPFVESMVFDDVRELDPGRYLVWNGALAGLLNAQLEFIVPLDRHTLTKTPYGYVTEKNGKFTVTGITELANLEFDRVRFYENWLQLEDGQGINLYNMVSRKMVQSKVDSLWFSNHVAFAMKKDSLLVMLRSGMRREFPEQTNIQFIKGPDSVAHFFSVEKNRKTVYELLSGTRLFQADFEEIESLGHQIFLITRDGKKGLLGSDGKPILPAEYSIILATRRDFASLFKDKKFGLFDLKNRKLIKAAFERNVMPFRSNIFIAYKDGYYGFIHPDSKPLGKFEFDEVREWSDSVALVKKNFQWLLYDVYSGEVILDKVKDYQPVSNSNLEKIIIFHRETGYGVVSSTKGVIIPATFTDIINIGSDEEPLYFTEKHVEEAEIYVVIYYDKTGKLIRRQVFEKEEYEKIYCED